jgi:hypothetical protein
MISSPSTISRERAAITAARFVLILVFCLTTAASIFSQDTSLAFKRAQHLRHGINLGWTMWDYAGGFSVVTRKDGATTPDPITIKALGLTVPAAPKP